jgi:hypothetical protein
VVPCIPIFSVPSRLKNDRVHGPIGELEEWCSSILCGTVLIIVNTDKKLNFLELTNASLKIVEYHSEWFFC